MCAIGFERVWRAVPRQRIHQLLAQKRLRHGGACFYQYMGEPQFYGFAQCGLARNFLERHKVHPAFAQV